MRRLAAALIAIGALAASGGALASDVDAGKSAEVLPMIGCGETLNRGGVAILSVTCDEAKVIDDMPTLQGINLINPDLTQTYVNMHHMSLTGTVATAAVVMALMGAYQDNPDLDGLRVEVAIAATDDYGNAATHAAFSFAFDRATYARVNWPNFDQTKLPKVAKRFAYSPWYENAIMRELY